MVNRCSSLFRLSFYPLFFLLASFSLSCSSASVVEKGGSNAYRLPSPEPTPVDSRADQFSVRMLEGGSAKFTDLIGNNKVVLVNFWATWCGPCRSEIPELVALQQRYKDRGLEVIGLAVEDPESDRDKVRAFAEQFKINYKMGFSPPELLLIFNGTADPRAPIPQTFIFDRNGKLVDRVRGFRRNFHIWVEGAVNHALSSS
jgi:thiol-disulfide isomerase/thioredoxin